MRERVADIVVSLVKTAKTFQMYGSAHPSARNFFVPFFEKIAQYLSKNPDLSLQIEQHTILYDNRLIYEESEKDISIAFRLFRDGVRGIRFIRGITSDELLTFVGMISQVTKEQDIALILWESDFEHIEFYVVEEEEVIDYQAPETTINNIDFDAKVNEILKRENINLHGIIDTMLSDGEITTLKKEIEHTTRMSYVPATITTLLYFLKIEKSKEIIESLRELLGRCVDNRDFSSARRIVHNLKVHAQMNPLDNLENRTTIVGFKDVVNTADDKTFNEFIAFVGLFSPRTVPFFIELLGQILRKERVLPLRSRVAYLAQSDPAPIIGFLESPNTALVVHAIALLGIMEIDDIGTYLESLKEHRDPAVRVEVVNVYKNIGKGSTVMRFIDDDDITVRIRALQAVKEIQYLRAYSNILRRIKHKNFLTLDFTEQKAYFNCFVAIGGRDVVKQLRRLLFKWKLFGRKRYYVKRQLAAMALAGIGTSETVEILLQGEKKWDKDIKAACHSALKQV